MPDVPKSLIRRYHKSRSLVSLTRNKIDQAKIQGFLLDYNDDWIALQYIHDFYVDGYLLLRRSDLTSLDCRSTDTFQRRLLESDGLLDQIDFDFQIPPGGVKGLLLGLPKEQIVILEDETEENRFLIGSILGIEDGCVSLRFFTGAGRWLDEPSEISLEDITSISFSTNYTLTYERHFSRESQSNGKSR